MSPDGSRVDLVKVRDAARMFDISENTVRRGWGGRLVVDESTGQTMVTGASVRSERVRRLALLGVPGGDPLGQVVVVTEPTPQSGEQDTESLRHVIATLLISEQAHLDAIRELTAPVTPNN